MGSNMAPYIYMERNGIHINLYKTAKIEEANEALKKSLHQVKKYYSCLLQKTNKRHRC
jgi:ribosomal protein S2